MGEEHINYGEWRPVPGFCRSALLVSSEGWVRTRRQGGKNTLGSPWKGSDMGTGVLRVNVGGRAHLVHRLVACAFVGPQPSGRHTVDHVNQQSGDNRATNLRWATRLEQRKNQGIRKKSRLSKPVVLTASDGTARTYASTLEAAKAIATSSGNISNAARSGCSVKGYQVEFKAEEDQGDLVVDGEVERWKEAQGDAGVLVSTMGRIQRRKFSVWGFRTTPGTKKRFGGYCAVRVANQDLLMHRLVLQTFNGPPPTKDATYTVDHINQIRHDNRLSNLRWATKSEQAYNTSRSKGVLVQVRTKRTAASTGAAPRPRSLNPGRSTPPPATAQAIRASGIAWGSSDEEEDYD
jgi:hypothetical protein